MSVWPVVESKEENRRKKRALRAQVCLELDLEKHCLRQMRGASTLALATLPTPFRSPKGEGRGGGVSIPDISREKTSGNIV